MAKFAITLETDQLWAALTTLQSSLGNYIEAVNRVVVVHESRLRKLEQRTLKIEKDISSLYETEFTQSDLFSVRE